MGVYFWELKEGFFKWAFGGVYLGGVVKRNGSVRLNLVRCNPNLFDAGMGSDG